MKHCTYPTNHALFVRLLPVLASNITIFPALVCKYLSLRSKTEEYIFESFHALAAILMFRLPMVILGSPVVLT
ncbi:hypothetical protein BD770DRAFT_403812 [Pilaira anomala]|nr:hypothetical protein BD770DRAFT_403812 [Pilaira anomala]